LAWLSPANAVLEILERRRSRWPARDVDQRAIVRAVEMLVVADIGVEIGALGIDRDLAQQPGRRELVQRVVDGGQRQGVAGAGGSS
jgi:hypothetical protein